MSRPPFKLLSADEERCARLIVLRNAVTPLLASNYLSHFTDHSVTHSDQLCDLVDQLASSLDQTKQLNTVEAAILYAACYFHDAGMQHRRADDTDIVRTILQAEPYRDQTWASLSVPTQQEIVRANHHRISRELVLGAVRTDGGPLGMPLMDNDKPGVIAAVCLAHCLSTESAEYQNATGDQGGIRVGLLSALLRLADILDESQRRTFLHLEPTTPLPLESRLHWWRHYYVSQIAIEQRAVTVWFDFPSECHEQYKELFEPLQLPWIESEFRRHSSVLAANGLSWHLQKQYIPALQCTARRMDQDLERFAVEAAVKRQAERLRQDRLATVRQLRVARPTVERQFASIRASTDSANEQLEEALKVAEHLVAIGGKRDGWMSLCGEFNRLSAGAAAETRLRVVLRLGEMMMEDKACDVALRQLQDFVPHFTSLPDDDSLKLRFLRIWAGVLRDRCAYNEAVAAFEELARITRSKDERDSAEAEIAEMHLLQGELTKLNVTTRAQC